MSKKVFLFEDEEIIYENIIHELEDEGFNVTLAKDGQDALKKVISAQPDIILLDLILPKLNGFEILKELKNEEKTKNIPVIILSNLGQGQDIRECMDLGAVDYMVKANVLIADVITKIKEFTK